MSVKRILNRLQNDEGSIYDIACQWSKETGDKIDDVIRLIAVVLRRSCNCPFIETEGALNNIDKNSNQQNITNHAIHMGARESVTAVSTLDFDAISAANSPDISLVELPQPHVQASQLNALKATTNNPQSDCTFSTLDMIDIENGNIEPAKTTKLSRYHLISALEQARIPIPNFLLPAMNIRLNDISEKGDTKQLESSSGFNAQERKNRRKSDLAIVRLPRIKGFRWEDVEVTFISNDAVRINVQDISRVMHFAEMGFKDGRIGDVPDTRWSILREFAKRNGEITWGDIDRANSAKMKAAVKDIRKRLKMLFGVDCDPFYPYRTVKAYKTRFKLFDATLA